MSLSFWQILIVAVLFLLLFGRGKIPQLMGDLAEGIRSFRKGVRDTEEEAGDDAPRHLDEAATQDTTAGNGTAAGQARAAQPVSEAER